MYFRCLPHIRPHHKPGFFDHVFPCSLIGNREVTVLLADPAVTLIPLLPFIIPPIKRVPSSLWTFLLDCQHPRRVTKPVWIKCCLLLAASFISPVFAACKRRRYKASTSTTVQICAAFSAFFPTLPRQFMQSFLYCHSDLCVPRELDPRFGTMSKLSPLHNDPPKVPYFASTHFRYFPIPRLQFDCDNFDPSLPWFSFPFAPCFWPSLPRFHFFVRVSRPPRFFTCRRHRDPVLLCPKLLQNMIAASPRLPIKPTLS